MHPPLPDAITEAAALRALDWPVTRRQELRGLLPSVPAGQSRIYQKSRIEELAGMTAEQRDELRKNGALHLRNGTAAAPPAEIHTRNQEFTRAAIDARARTVELSFSSEAPVSRWFGTEILSHSPGSVRLGRLNNGAALLLDHDPTKQIGTVVSARVDPDGKGRAKVRFGNSALANEIFDDVENGIRRLVSVGYRIHKQESQGKSGGVEAVRVTDWEPYELSIVSIPADDSVGVGRGIETAPGNSNIQISNSMNTTENLDPAAIERTRTTRILAMAEQGQRQGITVDANRAIADGMTPEQFREQLFEGLVSRNTAYQPPSGASMERNHGGNARGGLDMSRYSLCRAIHSAGQGRLDGLEAEVSQELARSMGKAPDGFYVPHGILIGQRAGLSVTGDSGNYGGDTVGLAIGGFIDALRPMLAVAQAGATVMSGLTGNVGLPRHVAASTASWKGEVAGLDEKSQEIDQVLLTPKRVGAWTKFSKQLVAQSSQDVENFVRLDLLAAVAVAFDAAAIAGTGADSQPTGILTTSGIGSVAGGTNGLAPTWAHLVALLSAVANANAAGARSSFLFSTKVEGKLRNTVKVTSTDSKMILEDGQTSLVGKPWVASNNVPDNLTKGTSSGVCSAIIFGNFADVVLASFGAGTDVVVDPYSLATSGQVKVVVNSYCDVGIRRAASFAAMKDALTA
jgi:HK97 family phage major capsid protein